VQVEIAFLGSAGQQAKDVVEVLFRVDDVKATRGNDREDGGSALGFTGYRSLACGASVRS
jgi:hypothetical protein